MATPIKRLARVIGGWLLLVAGVAMLVLPGPGLVAIAAGLALLATEYEWARRLLVTAKRKLAEAKDKVVKRDQPSK